MMARRRLIVAALLACVLSIWTQRATADVPAPVVEATADKVREHFGNREFFRARTRVQKFDLRLPDPSTSSETIISVKFDDLAHVEIEDGQIVRITSLVDLNESIFDANTAHVLEQLQEKGSWRRRSPSIPEQTLLADWMRAENGYSEQLPNPISYFRFDVTSGDIQEVCAQLNALSIIEIAEPLAKHDQPTGPIGKDFSFPLEPHTQVSGALPFANQFGVIRTWDHGVTGRGVKMGIATAGTPPINTQDIPPITVVGNSQLAPTSHGIVNFVYAGAPANDNYGHTGLTYNSTFFGASGVRPQSGTSTSPFPGHPILVADPDLPAAVEALAVAVGQFGIVSVPLTTLRVLGGPPNNGTPGDTIVALPADYLLETYNIIRTYAVGINRRVFFLTAGDRCGDPYAPAGLNLSQVGATFLQNEGSGAIYVRGTCKGNEGARWPSTRNLGPVDHYNTGVWHTNSTIIGSVAALVQSAVQQLYSSTTGPNGGGLDGAYFSNPYYPLGDAWAAVTTTLREMVPGRSLRVVTDHPEAKPLAHGTTTPYTFPTQATTDVTSEFVLTLYNDGREPLEVKNFKLTALDYDCQPVDGAPPRCAMNFSSTGTNERGSIPMNGLTGAELKFSFHATKAGTYTTQLRFDTNDPRLPGYFTIILKVNVRASNTPKVRVQSLDGVVYQSPATLLFGTVFRCTTESWFPTEFYCSDTYRFNTLNYDVRILKVMNASNSANLEITSYRESGLAFSTVIPNEIVARHNVIFESPEKLILAPGDPTRNVQGGWVYLAVRVDRNQPPGRWGTTLSFRTNDQYVPEFFYTTDVNLVDATRPPWAHYPMVTVRDHNLQPWPGKFFGINIGAFQVNDLADELRRRAQIISAHAQTLLVTAVNIAGSADDLTGLPARKFLKLDFITKVINANESVTLLAKQADDFSNASTGLVNQWYRFDVEAQQSRERQQYFLQYYGRVFGTGPQGIHGVDFGGPNAPPDLQGNSLSTSSTPTPVDIGEDQYIGRTQPGVPITTQFRIHNRTSQPIYVNNFRVTGKDRGYFDVHLSEHSINAGRYATLSVTFQSPSKGRFTAGISYEVDTVPSTQQDKFFTFDMTGEVCDGAGCAPDLPPTINTFSISPTAISAGQSATLTWSAANATSVSIAPGIGPVSNSGTHTVSQPGTYVLTATNAVGPRTASAKLFVVGDGPAGSPVIDSFTAWPGAIAVGQPSTLSWQVTGATSITIEPLGPVTGTSTTVMPSETTTFVLEATNATGKSSRFVTVQVNPSAPPVIRSFAATPETLTGPGQSTVLSWDVQGAATVEITPNVGAVTGFGSRTLSPSVSTTYTLRATNSFGTMTSTKTVTVEGTYTPGNPPVIQSFTPSSTSVAAGTPVTLRWVVENADLVVVAPPIEVKGLAGELTVYPQATSTYMLFARNRAGSVTRELVINVTGGAAVPQIQELTVMPQPVTVGEAAEIRWTTSGATSVTITPDIDAVPVSGVKMIRPAVDSLYVLNATNAAGSISKAFAVDTTPRPPQPLTKSVELLHGIEIASGLRLEDNQTTDLYDPVSGYAPGAIPMLIVNRSPGNLTIANATIENDRGDGQLFSLSSDLREVPIAPNQAVPIVLRWDRPIAPRGYEGLFILRMQDGTDVRHRFRFGVSEWRPSGSALQIRLTDAQNLAVTTAFLAAPFIAPPTTGALDLGVANSSATATALLQVHNDGTTPAKVTQAWCNGTEFSIQPVEGEFGQSIPAGGVLGLRVTAVNQHQSSTASCYVQLQAPGDASTQGAFAAFGVRALGLDSVPRPLVYYIDGNRRTPVADTAEVVVGAKRRDKKTMTFEIENNGTGPESALHLVGQPVVSSVDNRFRRVGVYYRTRDTVPELETVAPGGRDNAAFNVEFTGAQNGTYFGTVRLPMWGGLNTTPPYDWNHSYEMRIKIISGNGRTRVLQGQTELENGSGFDTNEPANFTVENTGETTLRLSNLAVPPHYRIASALPASLAAGQSGTFALTKAGSATPGAHYVSFSSDDPDEPLIQLRENRRPVAVRDVVTVSAGGFVPIDVTANDTDADSDGLALTALGIVTMPIKGTPVITDENTIVYTANAGTTGTDRLVYEISDGNGGIATAEVLITIGTGNRNPIANPDTAGTKPGRPVTIDVLANDSDPDGDPISLSGIPVAPANGTASVDGNSIRYTPGANFDGVVTFNYEITDSFGGTARGVVTVTVTNTAPVATDDIVNTKRNETITFNVTSNDSDADGDFIFLRENAIVVLPEHGTATRIDDHRIRYTPNRSFVGTDTLTYEIGDGSGGRDTAQVTIEVANSGPPAARNDHATTKKDTPATIDVLANDQDIDGQSIVLTVNPIKTNPRNGTAVRLSDTSVRYTPNAGWAGNDVFEYEIADASGNKDRAWVAVHVGRTRSLPVAVDDVASTTANRSITIDVLANDSSPDGEAIRLTGSPFITRPVHGTARRVSDAAVSYTPKSGWAGTDTFAYEITDTEGGTAAAFVTVTVTADNRPPVANNDSASTHGGASVTINVVANDTDPDNDPLTLLPQIGTPAKGSVLRVSDTSIAYTPNAGYLGTDSFPYDISDGHGGTARGTVTITISNANHPPEAVPDEATTTAGTAVTVNVTANDFDVDGHAITLIGIVTPPANGTAVKISGTSITYTPPAGFTGTARFEYEIGDGHGGSSRAWVDITIGQGTVNQNPVAVDDEATTRPSTSVDIVVTTNDSDPDGDVVYLVADAIRFAPAHGTAVRLSDTTVRYTPADGYVGVDTLQYEINDGRTKRARAWARITVKNPNSRPVAVNDSASTTRGTPVTVNVTSNDSDPDGNVVRLVSSPIIVVPASGTATKVDADSIKYTPNGGFSGTDRFQYEVSDGNGGRARAWVNVTVSGSSGNSSTVSFNSIGAAPVAGNDKSEGLTDAAIPVVVLANDFATGGRYVVLPLSPVITPPLSGTIQRTSDTTLTYTPQTGFRGNDRFEYEVVDQDGIATRAWVTVQVPGNNKQPLAVDDFGAVTYDGTGTVAITPLTNDSDPDGDPVILTVRGVATAPTHGTVRRESDSRLVYTAEPGYRGVDSFIYEITDGRGGTAQATILIVIGSSPQPPTAAPDTATVESGKGVTINVLGNDSDPDGDVLRVVSSEPPVWGSIVWDNGAVTYQSHYPYKGPDTFRYTVSDSAGYTAEAEVTVTVTMANRPPIALPDTAQTKTRTQVLIGVLANDGDTDYDQRITISSVTQPARGTVVITGNRLSVTYTPANDFAGTDTFQYTISDGIATATATVTVTVPNQAPIPRFDVLAAPEDTWVGYTAHQILTNDVDPDGDELRIISIEQPANGTFLIAPDKSQFSYQAKANWAGMDSFYYTVSDPFGASVRLMSQISVAGINDAPVANNDSFSVYKNQTLTITEQQVVANDTDVEGHAISVHSVAQGTNGTTKLINGTIEYQPYAEFVGTDSFDYTVIDGGGAFAAGRITVNVLQDTPPVASFTVTCTNLTCSFDASASTDDRGGITFYQWNLGNNQHAAGKSFTYTYPVAGSYLVRLTVHDTLNQSGTTTKTVTVSCPNPAITAQPTSRTITAGQPTTFTVTATGASSYQWYQGAAPSTTTPVGTNSSSFPVTPTATTSYWVKVTNTCGSTNSQTATVTLCHALGIATQPASQSISHGSSTILSVVASGSGPFSYQWYEGPSGTTTVPVGLNSPSFTTPALTASKSYWVRVTSTCNGVVSVNSATANITVASAPLARRQFSGKAVESQLSITGNWTQPTQSGTLLVAVISVASDFWPIANLTVPPGYQLAVTYDWSNIKTSIYYYPNNPGGRTSESFGTGGSNMFRDMILQLAEYTGAATVAPLDRTARNVGDNAPYGFVETGWTPNTQQTKEVVISAFTSYSNTEFYDPTNGFVKLDERVAGNRMTTAVHERFITAIQQCGHGANTNATADQWIGVIATFR